VSTQPERKEERKAEVVRRIVMGRERAPRSPRMERAFKRLIWRYTGLAVQAEDRGNQDVAE
jgi:hypothetical protein